MTPRLTGLYQAREQLQQVLIQFWHVLHEEKNVLFVPVLLLPRKTWRAREPRKNGEVDVPYRIGFFLLLFFRHLAPLVFCAPVLNSLFIGGHIDLGEKQRQTYSFRREVKRDCALFPERSLSEI